MHPSLQINLKTEQQESPASPPCLQPPPGPSVQVMAGVPALTQLNPAYNEGAQAAALLMAANQQLSHSPPASWRCFSADAAASAGRSNLMLG